MLFIGTKNLYIFTLLSLSKIVEQFYYRLSIIDVQNFCAVEAVEFCR
jgi:hypothetical protein